MIHVLLDSSIYRKDPQRKSVAFKALTKLGDAGKLVLHIPYFVQHEFRMHHCNEYSEPLEIIESALMKLQRKPLTKPWTEALKEQSTAFQQLKAAILNYVEQDFPLWCKYVGAKLHPVGEDHGAMMAKKYFLGDRPFGEPRKPDDIPDAFIYLTALDVAEGVDELAVVVADKRLRKACGDVANIVTYSSLDEFVKSAPCATAFKEVDVLRNFETLVDELKENAAEIRGHASSKLFDELEGYTFSDPSIPDDNNEAMISGLDVPSDIGLDFEQAVYYGGGIVALPFEFEMKVQGTYYIFKVDYYVLGEERATQICVSEYGNRHYFQAEEDFSLIVTGRIALTLDLSKVPHGAPILDHVDALVKDADVQVSDISELLVKHPYEEY